MKTLQDKNAQRKQLTFQLGTYLRVSSPVLYLDIDANVSGSTILSVQLWREEFESVSPTSEDCVDKNIFNIQIVMICDPMFYLTVTVHSHTFWLLFSLNSASLEDSSMLLTIPFAIKWD